jgi:pilus assembly protein Flp/PilA
MTKLVSRFLKDESGATAIEYGLIAALISVALITGATALGSKLNTMFNSLSETMDNATPKAATP